MHAPELNAELLAYTAAWALLAVLLYAGWRTKRWAARTSAALIPVLALAYLFMSGWDTASLGQKIHQHDFFHYYFGAKYYPEIGNTRLYDCTAAALVEMHAGTSGDLGIPVVRSLQEPWRSYPTADRGRAALAPCRTHFGVSRWQQFKTDLLDFQRSGDKPTNWTALLIDFGNNAPPSYGVLPFMLANVLPASPGAFALYPLFDVLVMLVLCPLLIARTCGTPSAAAYLLILSGNALGLFGWTTGSFLREWWVAATVLGICALVREKHFSAGLWLTVAALLKVFPAMFWIGAALPMLTDARPWLRLPRFVAGSATAAIILVACSLLLFGAESWIEFVQFVLPRVDIAGMNTVGFFKAAIRPELHGAANFRGAADALQALSRFDAMLKGAYDEQRAVFDLAKIALLLGAAGICIRIGTALSALLFGTTAIFLLATPFCYYYAFLALFGALFLMRDEASVQWNRTRFALTLLLLTALLVLSPQMGLIAGENASWTYYAVSSQLLLAWLLLLLGSFALDGLSARAASNHHLTVMHGITVVLLALGAILAGYILVINRPVRVDAGFMDAEALQIRGSPAYRVRKLPATAAWSQASDLQFEAERPSGDLAFELPVRVAGVYDVAVVLTREPGSCRLALGVPGHTTFREVDLERRGSARPMSVPIGVARLEPGTASLLVRPISCGRDGSHSPVRFAMDGVVLTSR